MIDYGLKDKVALITGANNPQGIGATTALAFAREGARVVLVYKRIDSQLEAAVLPIIPMGRLIDPEDIADTILFLASERAGMLTGQVIKVSGGHAL